MQDPKMAEWHCHIAEFPGREGVASNVGVDGAHASSAV